MSQQPTDTATTVAISSEMAAVIADALTTAAQQERRRGIAAAARASSGYAKILAYGHDLTPDALAMAREDVEQDDHTSAACHLVADEMDHARGAIFDVIRDGRTIRDVIRDVIARDYSANTWEPPGM